MLGKIHTLCLYKTQIIDVSILVNVNILYFPERILSNVYIFVENNNPEPIKCMILSLIITSVFVGVLYVCIQSVSGVKFLKTPKLYQQNIICEGVINLFLHFLNHI
uniref:Uncharacterized protein n=1 Tax=viral metagenome TaxID=1070528 RepID=A0A6C0AEM6_9ZZZZ